MSSVLFVESSNGAADAPLPPDRERPSDAEALDAYSQVVTAVARDLAPSAACAAGGWRWAAAARW
jgi:hypothetical protein